MPSTIVVRITEILLTGSCLILFLSTYPDKCRTTLWEYGGKHGFNSDPGDRIYFYANHKEPPPIPRIWSQEYTDSTLAICILSVIISAARTIMMRFQIRGRFIDASYDLSLAVLWCYVVFLQISDDDLNASQSSSVPWYLVTSTTLMPERERGCCVLARATLLFSIAVAFFYCIKVVFTTIECYRVKEKRGQLEANWELFEDDASFFSGDKYFIEGL